MMSKLANNLIINNVNKEKFSLISINNDFNVVKIVKEQQKPMNDYDFK